MAKLSFKIKLVIALLIIGLIVLLYALYVWHQEKRNYEQHRFMDIFLMLRAIPNVEKTWFQQDVDGNGIKDYWTYDVSCLRRAYRSDNTTKVCFIGHSIAAADWAPADISFGDGFKIAPLELRETWHAYYFRAMLADENGLPYNQNPVGTKKILATNPSKFGFVAYPVVYGEGYAIATFIINENEEMYFRDMGSDKDKIVLQWPKSEELKGPKAKWHRVE